MTTVIIESPTTTEGKINFLQELGSEKDVDEDFFKKIFELFPYLKKIRISSLSIMQHQSKYRISTQIMSMNNCWVEINPKEKTLEECKHLGTSWNVPDKKKIIHAFLFIQNVC